MGNQLHQKSNQLAKMVQTARRCVACVQKQRTLVWNWKQKQHQKAHHLCCRTHPEKLGPTERGHRSRLRQPQIGLVRLASIALCASRPGPRGFLPVDLCRRHWEPKDLIETNEKESAVKTESDLRGAMCAKLPGLRPGRS